MVLERIQKTPMNLKKVEMFNKQVEKKRLWAILLFREDHHRLFKDSGAQKYLKLWIGHQISQLLMMIKIIQIALLSTQMALNKSHYLIKSQDHVILEHVVQLNFYVHVIQNFSGQQRLDSSMKQIYGVLCVMLRRRKRSNDRVDGQEKRRAYISMNKKENMRNDVSVLMYAKILSSVLKRRI